ncbi:MAG: hypothetical protein QXQ19_01975 [Candidatus Aenigmatarchaeota archaeon]
MSIIKISYKKPKEINELKELEKNIIYIQEKIDGKLSDSFIESCIKIEKKLYLCLFGELVNIKDLHVIMYEAPANRIVIEGAILEDGKLIYLPPEVTSKMCLCLGLIIVPTFYAGPLTKKIIDESLNRDSAFKNTINPNLIKLIKKENIIKISKTENVIEGIVIKKYGDGFESYKIVRKEFEEIKKHYPRERYNHLRVKNRIRLYDPEEFYNYWEKYVFKPLGLKIDENLYQMAYENYCYSYDKDTLEGFIRSIPEENKKVAIKNIKELLLECFEVCAI